MMHGGGHLPQGTYHGDRGNTGVNQRDEPVGYGHGHQGSGSGSFGRRPVPPAKEGYGGEGVV